MRPVVIGLPLPLPLVGFRICCGFPSPADDWIEDAIDVSRLVVTNPAATFLWRASGDCMTPTILDGDYLVCDRSLAPVPGDVVVASSTASRRSNGWPMSPAGRRLAMITHDPRRLRPIRIARSASGAWSLGPCALIGQPDEAGDRAERRQLLLRLV